VDPEGRGELSGRRQPRVLTDGSSGDEALDGGIELIRERRAAAPGDIDLA
jgi:hypothetical protein